MRGKWQGGNSQELGGIKRPHQVVIKWKESRVTLYKPKPGLWGRERIKKEDRGLSEGRGRKWCKKNPIRKKAGRRNYKGSLQTKEKER